MSFPFNVSILILYLMSIVIIRDLIFDSYGIRKHHL